MKKVNYIFVLYTSWIATEVLQTLHLKDPRLSSMTQRNVKDFICQPQKNVGVASICQINLLQYLLCHIILTAEDLTSLYAWISQNNFFISKMDPWCLRMGLQMH